MTVDKYNDSENEDAQQLKGKIEGDVSDYFASKQKIKDDTSLFKQAEEDSMTVEENQNTEEDAPNSFFPQRPTPAKNYFQLLKQISAVNPTVFRYEKGKKPPPPKKTKPIADANAPKPKKTKPIVGGPQGLSEEQIQQVREIINANK